MGNIKIDKNTHTYIGRDLKELAHITGGAGESQSAG